MSVKDTIREEIKKKLSALTQAERFNSFEMEKAWSRGHRKALEDLLRFLDTIKDNPEQQFRDLVREMRDAQREYFKTRSHFVLARSKELERKVDEDLKGDRRPVKQDPKLF